MKYIIAGKNEVKGIVGNDSSDLAKYFELGWEVVGSRLDIIKMVQTQQIHEKTHTIVTVEDRIFFYNSFFKNVISWQDFKLIKLSDRDFVEDWTEIRNFSFLNNDKKNTFWEKYKEKQFAKYARYNDDYSLITEGFDKTSRLLESISSNQKYIVIGLRFRDHCASRSSPIEWWKLLIKNIKEKFNIPIFLVGKGSEDFQFDEKIIYLEKLQDFVALIQDNRCLSYIGASTGTMLLAFTAAKCPVHWVDHSNAITKDDIKENNAVMGGYSARFLQSQLYYYGSNYINAQGIDTIIDRI